MAQTPQQPRTRSVCFGRDEELSTLTRLLDRHGVVAILGPAGMGKTRLAMEFVARHHTPSHDLLWLECNTAKPLLTPEQRLRAWASVPPGLPPESWLPKQPPAVLVVDGYERLDEREREALLHIIEMTPNWLWLLTSQERPELQSASLLELGPLRADAGGMALLLERVERVRPDLLDDPAHLATISRIFDRLGGHPLAILLAASRLSVLNPAELERELLVDLEVLGDELFSHVKNTWSGLSVAEKSVLVQLTIFPQGFTWELARAVISWEGEEHTLSLLDGLRAKSLLAREPSPQPNAKLRLRPHMYVQEVVSALALEQGLASDLEHARARFIRHLSQRIERWGACLPYALAERSANGAVWLREHHAELQRALAWSQDLGMRDEEVRLWAGLVAVHLVWLGDADMPRAALERMRDLAPSNWVWRCRWSALSALSQLDAYDLVESHLKSLVPLLDRAEASERHEHSLLCALMAYKRHEFERAFRHLDSIGPDRVCLRRSSQVLFRNLEGTLRMWSGRADGEAAIEAQRALLRDTVSDPSVDGLTMMVLIRLLHLLIYESRHAEAWELLERHFVLSTSNPGKRELLLWECKLTLQVLSDDVQGLREALEALASWAERRGDMFLTARASALLMREAMLEGDFARAWRLYLRARAQLLEHDTDLKQNYLPYLLQPALFVALGRRDAEALDGFQEALGEGGIMEEMTMYCQPHLGVVSALRRSPGEGLLAQAFGEVEEAFARRDWALGPVPWSAQIWQTLEVLKRWHEDDRFEAATSTTPRFMVDDLEMMTYLVRREWLSPLARGVLDAWSAARTALVVCPQGFWAPGASVWYGFGQRAQLRKLFYELARARLRCPGEPVELSTLRDLIWPGEAMTPASLKRRLQTLLSTLRQMDLREVLERRGDGYLLSSHVPIVFAEGADQEV